MKDTGKRIIVQLWDKVIPRKWRHHLSVQMLAIIIVFNILFLGISVVFQYVSIGKILQKNYEEACIKRFQQAENNINNLCQQVNMVFVRVSSRTDENSLLQNFIRSGNKPKSERVSCLILLNRDFKEELTYNSNLHSINFYGNNGYVWRLDGADLIKSNLLNESELGENFYETDMYKTLEGGNLAIQWFGGYTEDDFGFVEVKDANREYFITAAKNDITGSGQIVINIKMEDVADIFCADNDGETENVYVIDGDNKIVAAQDTELIGMTKDFSDGERVQQGILRYQKNGIQILTYDLPIMGWKMVSEVPVKEVVRDSVYLRNVLLISFLLSQFAAILFSTKWINLLIRPLRHLVEAVRKVGSGQLGYILDKTPGNEIGILTLEFNRMSQELEEMFEKLESMGEEKRSLEIQSLRAQINPHMIYNTLNIIRWMAFVNDEKNIVESVTLLSDFLVPIFRKDSPICTLKEEIDYVKKYIAIMNMRVLYGYTLETDIPEECYQYRVVRFLLQPIVENSIIHGFRGRDSGFIRISMQTEGQDGFIKIEDDGCGISPETLERLNEKECTAEERKKVGVANVDRRLKIQYGEDYGLTIHNREESGTIVVLKVKLEAMNNYLEG